MHNDILILLQWFNIVYLSFDTRFTSDQQTHGIDTAFLWGPAFMVAPVLQEASTII